MGEYALKQLLFTLMLALASTTAMAEWTAVGESDNKGGYTAYADLATIRRADNKVKMWVLFDYKTAQKASGVNFLSEKVRREYNCKEEQMRTLAFSFFSWNMGGGKVALSYSEPREWVPLALGNTGEALWKIACGK